MSKKKLVLDAPIEDVSFDGERMTVDQIEELFKPSMFREGPIPSAIGGETVTITISKKDHFVDGRWQP